MLRTRGVSTAHASGSAPLGPLLLFGVECEVPVLVESRGPAAPLRPQPVLLLLLPHGGIEHVVGSVAAPGAGDLRRAALPVAQAGVGPHLGCALRLLRGGGLPREPAGRHVRRRQHAPAGHEVPGAR